MCACKVQTMIVISVSLWTTGWSARVETNLDSKTHEDPFDSIGKKVNLTGATLRTYSANFLKMAQCAGVQMMYVQELKVDPENPDTHKLISAIIGKQPKKFKQCLKLKLDQSPWKEAAPTLIGAKPTVHKETSPQGDAVAIQLGAGPIRPIVVSVKGTGAGESENCRDLVYEFAVFSKLKNIPADSATGLLASSDFVRRQIFIPEPPTNEGMISGIERCKQNFADVMPDPFAGATGAVDAVQKNLQDFVVALRAKFGVPIIIMGHSSGGDLANRAACHAMALAASPEVIGLGIGGGTAAGLCSSAYQIVHALDIPQRLGEIPPAGNAPVVLTPTASAAGAASSEATPDAGTEDDWGTDTCKCPSIENFCKKAPTATFDQVVDFSNRWSKECCRYTTHGSGALTDLLADQTTSVAWGERDLCPQR